MPEVMLNLSTEQADKLEEILTMVSNLSSEGLSNSNLKEASDELLNELLIAEGIYF